MKLNIDTYNETSKDIFALQSPMYVAPIIANEPIPVSINNNFGNFGNSYLKIDTSVFPNSSQNRNNRIAESDYKNTGIIWDEQSSMPELTAWTSTSLWEKARSNVVQVFDEVNCNHRLLWSNKQVDLTIYSGPVSEIISAEIPSSYIKQTIYNGCYGYENQFEYGLNDGIFLTEYPAEKIEAIELDDNGFFRRIQYFLLRFIRFVLISNVKSSLHKILISIAQNIYLNIPNPLRLLHTPSSSNNKLYAFFMEKLIKQFSFYKGANVFSFMKYIKGVYYGSEIAFTV